MQLVLNDVNAREVPDISHMSDITAHVGEDTLSRSGLSGSESSASSNIIISTERNYYELYDYMVLYLCYI